MISFSQHFVLITVAEHSGICSVDIEHVRATLVVIQSLVLWASLTPTDDDDDDDNNKICCLFYDGIIVIILQD